MRRDLGPITRPVAGEPTGAGAQPEASRWAISLFWASIAFAGFAVLLLITSFFI